MSGFSALLASVSDFSGAWKTLS